MFDYKKYQYAERLGFFLEEFQSDKLLKYIEKEEWLDEFCSDEVFFGSIELDMTYTTNQAARLLGLSRGQRILNLLNNKESELSEKYLKPQKVGDRYTHDAIIMFKFKLVFFLYSKGFNTTEIEHILGLTSATSVINMPRRKVHVQESINRKQIREVIWEQFGPLYEALEDFQEYHKRSVESLQTSFVEQLKITEEKNKLLNDFSSVNNEIAFLEKKVADLSISITTLTNELENFEQIKRLNLKSEIIAKATNQQPQPVAKQGFFQRLFGKQENTPSPDLADLEKQLLEIDRKSIKNLFNDKELEKYERILKAIKENTDELNKTTEYLGRARERKMHIEVEIKKLEDNKMSFEKLSKPLQIENPLKLHTDAMKQMLNETKNSLHDDRNDEVISFGVVSDEETKEVNVNESPDITIIDSDEIEVIPKKEN